VTTDRRDAPTTPPAPPGGSGRPSGPADSPERGPQRLTEALRGSRRGPDGTSLTEPNDAERDLAAGLYRAAYLDYANVARRKIAQALTDAWYDGFRAASLGKCPHCSQDRR
jgi:hypothetical protein